MDTKIAERIKKIRTTLDLSQKAYGEKLGVTDATVSGWESGRRTPTEAALVSMCREFNINYPYLVEGLGDMFSDLPETLLDEVAEEYDLDDVDKLLVKRYMQLSHEKRAVIKEYLESVFIKEKGG